MYKPGRLQLSWLASLALLAVALAAHGGTAGRVDPETLRTEVYSPEGQAFVRHNGDRFNNRPLYCNQTSAIVVAGDRPLLRFGNGSVLNGSFMAALARGNKAKWLHDWSDITSLWDYRLDGFCLPKVPPATVQLGNNCRAILLNRRLRPEVTLENVTLETLSQEVIIGLMGVTMMNQNEAAN